ncbi:hypothetical protein B5E77_08940 [Lachnoclostridium sp. An131]|uniref:hypothetical protein n=1 Tax=Lachnoclostridium sp. An131 TaxID=1965555 RepID=UPI000B3667A0|nr:hypothetical protein [Lachnoclostridium sp. An131]OUQ26606.1 hypothetical protein B5E77_08940 [Lachnoclostridium sp. An131]
MKRILLTIGGALLAAFLLVVLKNEYARLLPVSTYGMQAAIERGETENLFIGSSMFRQGLSIDVLEEELPGSSYILSYNGNQPALMAMELAYMLEEGLEVKNLYIDLYPYTAAADPWISDTKILLDTDLDFKIQAWRLMAENSGASFSDFFEFFVTANNEQLLTYPINNALVSSQFRNGGTLLQQEGSTREELYALGMLGSRNGLHEAQMEGYGKIAALAEEYGLNLYFLETPKYERMYADPDYMELYQLCLEEVQRLKAEWNGSGSFEVLCAEDLDFDSSDAGNFQDLIHLSSAGRTEYTRLLCGALKSRD